MRSDYALVKRYLVGAALLVLGALCAAYATIAYQSSQAAAAMPFAAGGFDERHFWVPACLAVGLLLTAIVTALKR